MRLYCSVIEDERTRRSNEFEPTLYLSWYEINGNNMKDLLAGPDSRAQLKFKDDPQKGSVCSLCGLNSGLLVVGLNEIQVGNEDDALMVLQRY